MSPQPDPNNPLTYRDLQKTDRITDSVRRSLIKFKQRPNAPREITFANGILQWKAPQNSPQVTHYRIYANSDANLVREIPAGQLYLNDNLAADRVFISAYNANSGLESVRVLGPAISLGADQPSITQYAIAVTY